MDLSTWWGKQPPIGKDHPYVVTCNGRDIAGFATLKEARDARDAYATVPPGTRKEAPCWRHNWEIRSR